MRLAFFTFNAWRETMSHIEINETRLEYIEQGTGQPVLFVHGALSDKRAWKCQMEAFGAKYRAIAYSRRYAHPNEDIPEGVKDRMMVHVEDLISFMKALDLTPAHLIGSSLGAYICLLVTRDHPKTVRTLTLCEPPLLPLFGLSVPPSPFQMLGLLLRAPGTFFAVAEMGSKALQPAVAAFKKGNIEEGLQVFAKGFLGEERFRRVPEERKQQMRDNVKTLPSQMGAGFPPFSLTDAQNIRVPTLLVKGEDSFAFFDRVDDRLQKSIPVVEREVIQGACHLMFEEKPEDFNRVVLDFLSRHSG